MAPPRQGSAARKLSGLVGSSIQFNKQRQGSSVVEQGTHKPLVGSSTLPSGTPNHGVGLHSSGASGRHYIGSTPNLGVGIAPHLRGHTATTKQLGGDLQIVAKRETATLAEARALERSLKAKKNPQIAIFHLSKIKL